MNIQNKKNQMAIRASLKSTLFNRQRKNIKQQERQNSSPPIQNHSPRPLIQQFRHFCDVYEYGDQRIGEGAHGIVQVCHRKDGSRTPYAVKIFRTGDPEIINTIRQTFQINRSLNDLNCVVKALDLFINAKKEEHHLVMEYCHYQSLEQKIAQHLLPEEEVYQIALQLSQAIRALHQRGVCHRDLKPDNILIGEPFSLRLIDFGVSKRFLSKGKVTNKIDMWTRTGSLFYQAPEIFMGGGYNEKVDIWSAGIILYQLLVGELPFQQETVLDTIEMIRDSEINYTLPAFARLKPLQQDLLKRLLAKDPDKRLSADGTQITYIDFVRHWWLHKEKEKKSTKSFDDIDMEDPRDKINLLQSTQLPIQNLVRNINMMPSIQEESNQNSLRSSWNYWDNHVHYVPQDGPFLHTPQIGTSQELPNPQTNELADFHIGLERTNSVQFEY